MTVNFPAQQEEGLSSDEVNNILKAYDLGKAIGVSRLRSGYANENYKIDTDRDSYLLRVCWEKGEHDIRHETKVLERLKKDRFPAAYPIPRIDGDVITRYNDKKLVFYDFIRGGEPALNEESVGEIGHAVAILNSMEGWEELGRKNAFGLDLCQENIGRIRSGDYVKEYPVIFDYFMEETDNLREPLQEELPQGLIHGDVFPDNTIFRGNQLQAIVDFEEVCTDTLLMDVGITINGFCFVNNRLDENLLRAFLTSYSSVRELSEKETELLPYYIRWGAHAMIAWHLKCLLEEYDPRKMERLTMFMDRVMWLRKSRIDLTL